MTLRLLVFGGNGQVGRELQRMAEAGHIHGTFPERAEADIAEPEAVRRAMRKDDFQVVVNAAAYTDVDGAEADADSAHRANSLGAGTVAHAAARRGVPIIHLSTDYVFDGTKGAPYVETDPVAPLGVYGRTKEAGERAVREANDFHVLVRTAWVFSPFGRNFVKSMLRAAATHDELRVVDDQRGMPTTAGDIARTITLISRRLVDTPTDASLYGTFHYASAEATTWYRFANAIFAEAKSRGGPCARLVPIGTADYPTAARRPADSRLDCGKIGRVYGVDPAVWCAGLCDTLDRLLGHTPKDAVA